MPHSDKEHRRPGAHARGEANQRTRDFVRRRWQLLALLALGFSTVVVVTALFEPAGFIRGFILGAGLTAVAAVLCFVVLMNDGSYTWRRGADAEELTADLLHRRLPDWDVVHGMFLVSADIDHVVVGPGGVVAVETKWTTVDWETQRGKSRTYLAALHQARRSAERLQRYLRSKGLEAEVDAMLVIWGRGAPSFGEGRKRVDGVLVVDGTANPEIASQLVNRGGFDAGAALSALNS